MKAKLLETIRNHKDYHRLTQREMAKRFDVDESFVSRVLAGGKVDVTLDLLIKWVERLGYCVELIVKER